MPGNIRSEKMGEEENKKTERMQGLVPLPPAQGGGDRDRWISKLEASFVYTDCYKLARDT